MKDLSLASLLAPVEVATFLEEYWEKKPLVVSGRDSHYYDNLFSIQDVGRLLFRGRPYEDVTLVKKQDRPKLSQPFDVMEVQRYFHAGYTVALNHLYGRHEALSIFCRSLGDFFTYGIGANMYLTPRNSQGFRPHYDYHDVLALQIWGTKKWYLYGLVTPPLPADGYPDLAPDLYAQPKPDRLPEVQQEIWLKPGDLLYLPRGVVHEASTGPDAHSLHLTIGVYNVTWGHLLVEALEVLTRRNVDFRRSVLPSLLENEGGRSAIKAQAAALVKTFLEQLGPSLEEARQLNVTNFRKRPSLLPDYGSLFEGSAPVVELDTIIRKRDDIAYKLVETDGQAGIFLSSGHQVMGPARLKPVFQYILAVQGAFAIRQIPYLSDQAKLTLGRRLVFENALVPV
ncbi:MAG: cupin domain-containing protein [Chloroflexota bacterium]